MSSSSERLVPCAASDRHRVVLTSSDKCTPRCLPGHWRWVVMAWALGISATIFLVRPVSGAESASPSIRFGRDILPILSDNCFACHGPDASKREADLRLDSRDGVLRVVSLTAPGTSELLTRLTTADETTRMPPPQSHKKPLSAAQVDLLRQWIAEGLPWGQHWSLEKPVKTALLDQGRHPIDVLVEARLAREQPPWQLSPPAPLTTLARRVSLDLTGLPPTLESLETFLDEARIDRRLAYARYVERLLASDQHAERLAMWWLDAARYADTDGYQGDETRANWPWRDWVVNAFRRNLPFDQFTLEQFAGDLLPNATAEQRLATCFHRNHMTNGEGGRDPEESRIDYVIDRVNTMGTVWLGLTLGCCQCHSHKYDPISQHDFYSLSAFFDSIDEDGKAGKNARPYLSYQSPYGERAVAEARRLVEERRPREAQAKEAARPPFAAWLAEQSTAVQRGIVIWHPLQQLTLESVEGTQLVEEGEGLVQTSGPLPRQDDYRVAASVPRPRITGIQLEVWPHSTHTNGQLSRGASGEFILTDIKFQIRRQGSSQVRDLVVAGAVADVAAEQKEARSYGSIQGVLDDDPRNGWTTRGHDPRQMHRARFELAEPERLEPDEQLVCELRHRSTVGDANIGRFRILVTDQAGAAVRELGPAPLEELAAAVQRGETLPDPLRERLFQQFLVDYEPYQQERRSLERATKQLKEVETAAGKLDVMVLAEKAEPRTTHVLVRGVWDKKGDVVSRGFPAAIAPSPAAQTPLTREHLARWLVSQENPLTARVVVNHLWQLLFGAGLVRTTEDFGVQGERPTHAELLDWLAVDLQEHGWDLRHTLRQIVLSETYQQDSRLTPELRQRDPENRLLARGARFRLPSWMLRDAALQASGLLNPALGGPPVRPYQPAGVWEEMFMGRFKYEPSDGDAQYRRTLYAFWRRAIAPTFLFDSAQRRVCEVRPVRTNTPLQALTLLNDANFLVAAGALADRVLAERAPENRTLEDADRLRLLVRQVLCRDLPAGEQTVLARELTRARNYYRQHPAEAQRLRLGTRGNSSAETGGESHNSVDQAAYTLVASLVLNLDEAVTRE